MKLINEETGLIWSFQVFKQKNEKFKIEFGYTFEYNEKERSVIESRQDYPSLEEVFNFLKERIIKK